MKYIPLFLISIFLFLSNNIYSQNFKKGYIITNTNDTLDGLLLDEQYELLSRKVGFKANRKRKQITYFSPNDIKGFAFRDGDFFQSFEIEYSYQDKKGHKVDVNEARFLHRIEGGNLSLFELEDDWMKPLFIQKAEAPPILLCQTYYLKNLNAQTEDLPAFNIPETLKLRKQEVKEVVELYNDGAPGLSPTNSLNSKLSAWGSLAFPISKYVDRYKGIGYGAFVEYSPFSKEILKNFSVGIGLQRVNLERPTNGGTWQREEKSWEYTLRLNYYMNTRSKIAPYAFLGASIYDGSLNRKRLAEPETGTTELNYFTKEEKEVAHVGAGFQINLKRHFIKFEIGVSKDFHVKLGYGFSIF